VLRYRIGQKLRALPIFTVEVIVLCVAVLLAGCTWRTESADVIVLGAGVAGLSAAVTAAEHNASVLVIDRMDRQRGSKARTAGSYNSVDPQLQTAIGVSDSPRQYAADTRAYGNYLADPQLVHILSQQSRAGLTWLESYGITFSTSLTQEEGSSTPRTHHTQDGESTLVRTLRAAAVEYGVRFRSKITPVELVTDNNGRVVIVRTKNASNRVHTYRARRGVVLADPLIPLAQSIGADTVSESENLPQGVRINARTQVLDTNGRPIPGLFASGKILGGVHGTHVLPGNGNTAAVVFGRIAGAGAADLNAVSRPW